MDLFAKDHPLEAAALREKIAKSRLRSFVFEELPPTERHRIYRELLLKPNDDDSQSEAEYFNEHDEIRDRIVYLGVEFLGDNHEMHPEIIRTNKKIHEEAAAVLYGENWFTWSLYGRVFPPIWHWPDREMTLCPHRYSRLIMKLHLIISTNGDEVGDPGQVDAIFRTTTNLKKACQMLSLNDFKILMVSFYNGIGRRHGGKEYYGQRCLEPLKKCRAEKFLIRPCTSARYASKLKAVIEGPKDARFQAYRKAMEVKSDSDIDEPEQSDDETGVFGSDESFGRVM